MSSPRNTTEYYNSFDTDYLKKALSDLKKSKVTKKYWYRTDIESCVLCGRESVIRTRVYSEDQKGMHFSEDACSHHFM